MCVRCAVLFCGVTVVSLARYDTHDRDEREESARGAREAERLEHGLEAEREPRARGARVDCGAEPERSADRRDS